MNSRQKELIEYLTKTGHISVIDEAKRFNVSEMTIRRDLQFLEKKSFLTRIHGGAIPTLRYPASINSLLSEANEKQVAIARLAVSTLRPNSTVILNVGSTVLEVAREIRKESIPLTVVTNSLEVAITLYQSECEVLLTGGSLRRTGVDLVGPITEKNLDEYYIDTLIAGCDAADSQKGFFTSDINLAEIEKKCVEIAGKVIIVSESDKFKRSAMVKFVNTHRVATFITDKDISDVDTNNLSNANVKVIKSN